MLPGTSIETERFLQTDGYILDVRSPGEFAQGHIPGATNIPLFTDEQRAEIGTIYKQLGRQSAVRRGLGLASKRLEDIGNALISAQAEEPGKPLLLHCWRGGMRSNSMAWLAETLDLQALVLEGGYKAYRRWVLTSLERPWPLRLLGGRTGAGKTELLGALREKGVAVVDLEGLANHRGSSFGGLGLPPQPSVEQFENNLAAALQPLTGASEIWVEAESAQVGRCRIPAALWKRMKSAPLLEIQRPLPHRLATLVNTYGHHDPETLVEATLRISKRLGPQRTRAAVEAIRLGRMEEACAQMLDYYDRCYDKDTALHPFISVDLGDRQAQQGAEHLLQEGLILPGSRPTDR